MAQNNEFLQAALERLKKEAGSVSGQKEKAMAGAVRKALEGFCRQEPEFAQAIVQGGSFEDCMSAVAKGVGNSISDSEALDEAKKERARAEEELDKARREAEAAAKSLAALQRELALAAPELAVFRSRFERVQADLSELVQSVATLPADKQAGARRGLAALLDGMKGQIGGGEDG